MSSADRVPFVLNERYVSPDLNTLQNLWARWLTDVRAYANAYVNPNVNTGGVGNGTMMQVVLGGLEVSANGTSIDVQPGALIQTSPIAPLTDDPITGMSFGFNIAVLTVATPSPVTDTWCLVQMLVSDADDPTVSVDIYNGSFFVSTPGQVKRVRRELSVNIVQGSATSVPVPTAGWVPIAGLFRPAGGGAVLNAHIVDLRPMLPVSVGTPHELRDSFYRTADLAGTQTTMIMNTTARLSVGEVSFVPSSSSPTAFDPTVATIKATGSPAVVANEWWYLYLCPLSLSGAQPAIRPRHLYASYKGEGVLVLSNVAPRPHVRDNSGTITLPTPFSAHTVSASQAVLVGALRRNSANTGWLPMNCVGDHVVFADKVFVDAGPGAAPLALFTAVGGVEMLPAGARSFDAAVTQITLGVAGTVLALQDPTALVQRYPVLHDASVNTTSLFLGCDLTAGQSYEMAVVSGGGGTYSAKMLGFRF